MYTGPPLLSDRSHGTPDFEQARGSRAVRRPRGARFDGTRGHGTPSFERSRTKAANRVPSAAHFDHPVSTIVHFEGTRVHGTPAFERSLTRDPLFCTIATAGRSHLRDWRRRPALAHVRRHDAPLPRTIADANPLVRPNVVADSAQRVTTALPPRHRAARIIRPMSWRAVRRRPGIVPDNAPGNTRVSLAQGSDRAESRGRLVRDVTPAIRARTPGWRASGIL